MCVCERENGAIWSRAVVSDVWSGHSSWLLADVSCCGCGVKCGVCVSVCEVCVMCLYAIYSPCSVCMCE